MSLDLHEPRSSHKYPPQTWMLAYPNEYLRFHSLPSVLSSELMHWIMIVVRHLIMFFAAFTELYASLNRCQGASVWHSRMCHMHARHSLESLQTVRWRLQTHVMRCLMIIIVQCMNTDGSVDGSIAIYMPLSSESSVPWGLNRIPTVA